MSPDNAISNGKGHPGRLEPFGSPAEPRLSSPRWQADDDRRTRPVRRTARRLRQGPGIPPARSRFLIAHARWIAAVTLAAVGAAAALVFSQQPVYQSAAVVAVQPAAVAAGSGNSPDMATEEGIVSSDAVLAMASRSLNVPIATLASGLSTKVPGTTSLMQIRYSDPDPAIAQQRAQAIARAYVSYRPPPKPAKNAKVAALAPVPTAPSATLITPASLPTSPVSPNTKIDMGAALIVGLALALGTAWLRDRLDDSVRGSLDLEAQADAPVLAVIPAFRSRRRNPASRLVMVTNPHSVVAEAYRGLRTRLVQAAASRNASTLLVTSPGWEDKSTVAANLAAALAQSGHSVVLVCTDLRWGRAHQLFGLRAGDGLTGFLAGRAPLMGVFQPTSVPGLRLLPPGAIPPDPGALIQQPAMAAALSAARRHADVVVIEAPPMLASPDVGPLADAAEMILIVADARRSTRTQVHVALREVEHVRGMVVGCVLDNAGRRRHLRGRRRPAPAAGGRLPTTRRRLASGSQTVRRVTSSVTGGLARHVTNSAPSVPVRRLTDSVRGRARLVTTSVRGGPVGQPAARPGAGPDGDVRVTTTRDDDRPDLVPHASADDQPR